jgi:hypothetical protein
MGWYNTGTVTVTNGSTAVIGTGTAFIANSRVGDAFRGPDGGWYEVTNIASATALSIAPNYQGASVATGGYSLAPMQGYVKDSADQLRAATKVIGSTATDMTNQVSLAQAAAESAATDKDSATVSATSANQSKNAAAGSATTASAAKDQSVQSASAALTSRNASKASETNAANSAARAEAAAGSVTNKASAGANSDITSLSGMTTPLSVTQGGTGGGTQIAAQTALGLTKVVSTTDTTAGRVVTPGWMGLGGGVVPVNSGNFNTFGNASIFIVSNGSSNSPTGTSGSYYVIHLVATTDLYIYQRATNLQTGGSWERQMRAGVWDASWTALSRWGAISGTLSAQTDLQTALDAKLSLSDDKRVPKAWVRFNSSGGVIDNFNTPTVTRNSAGDFSLNHATALPSASRLVLATGSAAGGAITSSDGCYGTYWGATGSTASLTRVKFLNFNGGAFADPSVGFVIIY